MGDCRLIQAIAALLLIARFLCGPFCIALLLELVQIRQTSQYEIDIDAKVHLAGDLVYSHCLQLSDYWGTSLRCAKQDALLSYQTISDKIQIILQVLFRETREVNLLASTESNSIDKRRSRFEVCVEWLSDLSPYRLHVC